MDARDRMQRVRGLMVFLGAVSNGLEVTLGKGADAVCFLSGRKLGLSWEVAQKEADLFKAIDAVRDEMLRMGINWPFKLYKWSEESDVVTYHEGHREIKMPFENCIVRCTLFRYGFPQKKSLCQTKHGLFCGLFENIYGKRATLDILHAGENACLLKLKVYD